MKRVLIIVLLAVLTAGCATVATSGDYTLEPGETLEWNLIITSGHATLEENSRVNGSVLMTSGTLDVKAGAEIEGDVFFTSGNVRLARRAIVHGDVTGTSGNVFTAEGARVDGKISTDAFDFGASVINMLCVPPLVLLGVFLYWLIDRGRKRSVTEARTGRSGTAVGGLVLILIGAAFLLRDVVDLNLGNWWALLILIPAVSYLIDAWSIYQSEGRLSSAVRGSLVSGAALSLVAVIFLLGLNWTTLWPVLLIIVGLGVLVSR